MSKITKVWIEELTRKDGTKVYTGHIREKGLIFSTRKDLILAFSGSANLEDFVLINSSANYNVAYEFESLKEAQYVLSKKVNELKVKFIEEQNKQVIRSKEIKLLGF